MMKDDEGNVLSGSFTSPQTREGDTVRDRLQVYDSGLLRTQRRYHVSSIECRMGIEEGFRGIRS